MSKANDRGPLDWLVEVAGASAPAAAAGFAALKLAPVHGWPVGPAVLVGFSAIFALAVTAMRVVPVEARHLALPDFERPVLFDDSALLVEALGEGALLLDQPVGEMDELLLDVPYMVADELLLDRPLIAPVELTAVAELLLDDPLPSSALDSRVVQLFAGGRMPTAGQLQRRIDRHLAGGEQYAAGGARLPVVTKDATDALGEALAELRRTLRQA